MPDITQVLHRNEADNRLFADVNSSKITDTASTTSTFVNMCTNSECIPLTYTDKLVSVPANEVWNTNTLAHVQKYECRFI